MSQTDKLKNMRWRKINAPQTWRPEAGDELIGFYGGRTKREGSFGQYEVVIVLVPYKGAFMVSGTALIQLCDAATLIRGDAIRILYLGMKDLPEDKQMKMFELYVGEIERADDIPDEIPITVDELS